MNDPHFENRLVEFAKQFPEAPPHVAIQSVTQFDPRIYSCPSGPKTAWKGKLIRAVRTTLITTNLEESFHEFVVRYLVTTLGESWLKANRAKPTSQRHVVVRWLDEEKEFRKKAVKPENKQGKFYEVVPSGSTQALVALADDVYRLKLIDAFPKKIRKRLQNMNTFQSARYEVLAAAAFARCGFSIDWVDQKSTTRVPEFIATNKAAGETVAVEAKSRHRLGILGQPGETPSLDQIRADFYLLYKDALTQYQGSNAYVIFIDLNVPLQTQQQGFQKAMWHDIQKVIDEFPIDTSENPAPFSLCFMTNHSWHYDGEKTTGASEVFTSLPYYTTRPFKNHQTFNALRNAVNSVGKADPNE